MIGLRLRSARRGAHIYAKVYVSEDLTTFALAGELTMREGEYQAFRNAIAQGAEIQKLLRFEETCDLSGDKGGRQDLYDRD